MPRRVKRTPPSTSESLQEYARGIAGGFLFSLPLLLTHEIWTVSVTASPARLAVGLLATFVLLCGYNAYAGLRYDSTLGEVLIDSVEELGIGLGLGAAILLLFGRIGPASGLSEALGPVLMEGLFVAVGVSVGTAQLTGSGGADRGMGRTRDETISGELVLACCGAMLIAANVAPTNEVLLVASEMSAVHLLLTVALSLMLAGTVLYFSNFTGSSRFAGVRGLFGALHGTAITYAAALVVSAAILWFFGQLRQHPLALQVAQCVVLGLVATLGAAAGRLFFK